MRHAVIQKAGDPMAERKVLLLLFLIGISNGLDPQPEQIHLSSTGMGAQVCSLHLASVVASF